MKKVLLTALAVVLASPVVAHDHSTMNTDNELFESCSYTETAEVCHLKREHMPCEDDTEYDVDWNVYVEKNGLPRPLDYKQIINPQFGPMSYIVVRLDQHYMHTYIHIELERVFCLGTIGHMLGDPA